MAWCPFAVDKRLPEWADEPPIAPRVLIYHSIVGSLASADAHFRHASSLEAHFGVDLDGTIWQWQTTSRQADANYRANDFAVSIETADNGDPDDFPWTDAQLTALVKLGNWVLGEHSDIERRRCDGPYGSGIGHHTMWGAPSAWTPVNKSCPGAARIRQFDEVLLPALLGTAPLPMEVDMFCSKGDTGESVRLLQIQLTELGHYTGKIDAKYGPKTSAAVLAMRHSQGAATTSGDEYNARAYSQMQAALFKHYSTGLVEGHLRQHTRIKALEDIHPGMTHSPDGTPIEPPPGMPDEFTAQIKVVR